LWNELKQLSGLLNGIFVTISDNVALAALLHVEFSRSCLIRFLFTAQPEETRILVDDQEVG
jgi:hypothetical protein